MTAPTTHPIAWLLLRDRHTVPILGLHPDELKGSRKNTEEYPGQELSHVQGLTAIVDRLGFDGDFGDYKRKHFPELKAQLENAGAHRLVNLISSPEKHDPLGFLLSRGSKRRNVADRLFESSRPFPKRVFLTNEYQWENWFHGAGYHNETEKDLEFTATDLEEARKFVTLRRGNVEFLYRGDQLVDIGSDSASEIAVDLFYQNTPENEKSYSRQDFQREFALYRKVTEVFRWIIDQSDDGWFDVVRLSPNLAALVGDDGRYDLVWRYLRTKPAPDKNDSVLAPRDTPAFFNGDISESLYFFNGSKEEFSHAAETSYYAQGGTAPTYPGSSEVLRRYLVEQGELEDPARQWPTCRKAPQGFTQVTFEDGHQILVSDLVKLGAFRRRANESEYWTRRDGIDWDAANENSHSGDPVIATALDAFAYLAWVEKELNVTTRLLTPVEYRELLAFASEHYARMRDWDFPWETNPPRDVSLPTALVWSEDRFIEGPPVEEDPKSGMGRPSRRRWIEEWPPSVKWNTDLKWLESQGLKFIDAWDAAEWVGPFPGYCASRYWQGPIGEQTWGAYKNLVTTFRIVIDVEDDAEGPRS